MDLNDIHSRIERISRALGTILDPNWKNHILIIREGNSSTAILPGKEDRYVVFNKVMSILHHFATFKDHFKNWLAKHGYKKQTVEDIINNSIHLQTLMDLVNADKHGYPVKKSRSKKNPRLHNVKQILKNNNNGQPIVMSIAPDGELDLKHGVPPSIVLIGDVYDDNGNLLFDLDELVNQCYYQWIGLARKYKILP